ncbi:MAG: hypothetical protein EXS55_02070, partial [Candidatus Magasanikbacteria bacterium]|nr:hypothetical protein [Candidatus Magasanikbacteria bacterium]
LFKNHKLKQAEKIIVEFVVYAKKQAGIQEIEIMSAHELDSATLKKIKEAFGAQVEAKERTDEKLLGGFVVKTSDKIFDASLKKQLAKFKEKISY